MPKNSARPNHELYFKNKTLNNEMLKFIASRRLHIALQKMEAPMRLINVQSHVFQDVITDIKLGRLSPHEGAKFVLNTVYRAFDRPVAQ